MLPATKGRWGVVLKGRRAIGWLELFRVRGTDRWASLPGSRYISAASLPRVPNSRAAALEVE